MSPNEQFILQMTVTLTGFLGTLALGWLKDRADRRERAVLADKVDHVSKAVNGIPGEPTVKQQTAIIQDTIRREVLPRIADTNATVKDAATAAQTAATKADAVMQTVVAQTTPQKEGC